MTPPFALLDLPDGRAYRFSKLLRTLVADDGPSFAACCSEVEAETERGRHVVAALDYELGHVFEPATGTTDGRPLARWWLFVEREELCPADIAAWLAREAGEPPRPACVADFRPQMTAAGHAAAVGRVRDLIAAGDCYQVNLTFPFTGVCIGDPLALYARLRAAQPVGCGGLVWAPDACIVSFSPELFIERGAGKIRSRPMKGTAPRGKDAAADAAARDRLAASAKDRAENIMIVDLIRNDLGRVARPGSVSVEALCEIETYPTVHQMTSTVAATCDADLATVLGALFPCGSITGAPKVRAMQIIRELEGRRRGLYTGALGWIGAGGDFRFNVAIRTLSIAADGQVDYGAGSGIVWDSDPAAEYAESLLKAAFVTAADPGFHLIETLRLADGRYPQVERHLQRLQASAAYFHFVLDRESLVERLEALARSNPAGVFRVRLTLGQAGGVELAAHPLLPTPAGQRAIISPLRLAADSPWLRHKTTVRANYDRELARLAAAEPAVFDAIFLNERGEVCEGGRSNVFVRRRAGEPLLTPPLSCGLLPGVLRGMLLDGGEAEEAVLYEDDLRSAAELYLGNALRGLVPVVLAAGRGDGPP